MVLLCVFQISNFVFFDTFPNCVFVIGKSSVHCCFGERWPFPFWTLHSPQHFSHPSLLNPIFSHASHQTFSLVSLSLPCLLPKYRVQNYNFHLCRFRPISPMLLSLQRRPCVVRNPTLWDYFWGKGLCFLEVRLMTLLQMQLSVSCCFLMPRILLGISDCS